MRSCLNIIADTLADESRDAHQQVYGDEHEAKFSHELIGGAAAFEGMKLFEDQQRREGERIYLLEPPPIILTSDIQAKQSTILLLRSSLQE